MSSNNIITELFGFNVFIGIISWLMMITEVSSNASLDTSFSVSIFSVKFYVSAQLLLTASIISFVSIAVIGSILAKFISTDTSVTFILKTTAFIIFYFNIYVASSYFLDNVALIDSLFKVQFTLVLAFKYIYQNLEGN
jgi:hypothetical protein